MFPNLSKEKNVALDIETYDPDIKEKGPGPRRDGYVLGVGISAKDKAWYFPLAHKDKENNLEKEKVYAWLSDTIKDKNVIAANGMYDFDYLQYQGCSNFKNLIDVQIAEALIDENRKTYSLDSLGEKYVGSKKYKTEIERFCEMWDLKGDPRRHLYKMDSTTVGKYCIEDCLLTKKVFDKQIPILKNENLWDVFTLETELLPLLLQMRKTGVRIDTEKLKSMKPLYEEKERKLQKKLDQIAGFSVNVKSNVSIHALFKRKGYTLNYTKKGAPSYDKYFLSACHNDIAHLILDIRSCRTIQSNFITSLTGALVGDRIHCLFHPVRNIYGSASGRFSSTNPNLQQQPPEVRSIFIPENGCNWVKIDYSQIEYRVFAHYARGRGADELRQAYIDNPFIDFHVRGAAMLNNIPEEEVTKKIRKPAKNINFGVMYGMGAEKLVRSIGKLTESTPPGKPTGGGYETYKKWQEGTRKDPKYKEYYRQLDEGMLILNKYHDALPCLKTTFKYAMNTAQNRGYVKTIMGRRARLPYGFHRALNRVVQGTAADIMKKGMLDCYKAGVWDILPLHLTVHDELDFSKARSKEAEEASQEVKHIMETCIKLEVPIIADMESGPNWLEVK